MRFAKLLLSACLTILVLGCAGAAFASPAPAPAAAPSESDTLNLPACAAGFDFAATGEEAPLCRVELPGSDSLDLEWMAGFRGYCRCSCSFVKNCNTSADCGGSACLGGVTCC